MVKQVMYGMLGSFKVPMTRFNERDSADGLIPSNSGKQQLQLAASPMRQLPNTQQSPSPVSAPQ